MWRITIASSALLACWRGSESPSTGPSRIEPASPRGWYCAQLSRPDLESHCTRTREACARIADACLPQPEAWCISFRRTTTWSHACEATSDECAAKRTRAIEDQLAEVSDCTLSE